MRDFLHFRSFTFSDEGARVGRLEPLRNGIDDFGAGGLGQRLEFVERLLGGNLIARAEFDSDQNRAFDLF